MRQLADARRLFRRDAGVYEVHELASSSTMPDRAVTGLEQFGQGLDLLQQLRFDLRGGEQAEQPQCRLVQTPVSAAAPAPARVGQLAAQQRRQQAGARHPRQECAALFDRDRLDILPVETRDQIVHRRACLGRGPARLRGNRSAKMRSGYGAIWLRVTRTRKPPLAGAGSSSEANTAWSRRLRRG